MSESEKPTPADPYQTRYEPGVEPSAVPTPAAVKIGRYRTERILGEGSFGRVYLAHDDTLGRPVAIKVPHKHLVSGPESVANFLAEARTLASVDHPNIVPVYDFGSTDEGQCYVVSKYVQGSDLASKIEKGRLPLAESARIVAVVAEALNHAHLKGLVHRDIKPANILLRVGGMPYVCDFGIALRSESFGEGAQFTGSPAYMSPEQARGQAHRVDNRSDIFSLGTVLYQLLTGRLPFEAATLEELLDQINTTEVRPPREVERSVPLELQRICLKAMAKRVTERYTTALELAEDLKAYFLEPSEARGVVLQRAAGAVTVLSVEGDIDSRVAPIVSWQFQQILGTGKKYLVFDLSEVSYIASAGIRSVLLLYSRAKALDGRLVLAGPSESVQKTFEYALRGVIEIYPTVEAAVDSFPVPGASE